MKTFLAPWDNDPTRYPAWALEKHSAHCRVLGVPDSTHPSEIRHKLTDEAVVAGENAVKMLYEMEAWKPAEYDPDYHKSIKEDITTNHYRHYAFWGGRGGGKSHEAAEAIVELASVGYERVVCGREFMASIRDSSRSLLVSKIKKSKWVNDWKITDRELKNTRTGSLVTFMGINRNPDSARSLEGCTLFFGEEAETFSENSLDILLPTIRSPGSRLIWLWNPAYGGPVDTTFRMSEPPERSYVRCVLCEDNPWFYRTEMPGERRAAFLKSSPAKYRHIWRGALDTNPELSVYTNWSVGRYELPAGAVPLYGLDFGWTDPLAMLEFFVIEPENKETEKGTIYIAQEIYGSHIPIQELRPKIDEKMPAAVLHTVVADSAEPKSIHYLKTGGLYVIPASKGAGSIRAGISQIQGYNIIVSPECPNTAAELQSYNWKTTKNGIIVRDPEDKNNHAMDALRYGMESHTEPAAKDVVYI